MSKVKKNDTAEAKAKAKVEEIGFFKRIGNFFVSMYDSVRDFFNGSLKTISAVSGVLAVGAHYLCHMLMAGGILYYGLNTIVAVSSLVFVVAVWFWLVRLTDAINSSDEEVEAVTA